MEIQGLKSLVDKLRKKAAEAQKENNTSAIVGYTAKYALAVHENVAMKWRGFPRDQSVRRKGDLAIYGYNVAKKGRKRGLFWGPAGQAKFLEQPARELRNVLANIVATAIKAGRGFSEGLLLAALRLQRESQKLVPVDTGNLRNTAFTRLEK